MKKTFPLIVLPAFFVLLATPFFVSAQFDYGCNPPCSAGFFCNSNRTCVSYSSLAQSTGGRINTGYIQGYADSIIGIINDILVPVLIAISFLVFLFGIYKYFIKGADSDSDRETGRTFALYGVIGFVVIFSVWGIVQIFRETLNLGSPNSPTPPTIGTGTQRP